MRRIIPIALVLGLLAGCRTGIEISAPIPSEAPGAVQYGYGAGRTNELRHTIRPPLSLAWTVSLSGSNGASKFTAGTKQFIIPTLLQGVDIITASDGSEFGWITTEGAVLGTPASLDSTMYIPITGGAFSVMAVDIPTASVRWMALGDPVETPALVLGGNIIVAGMFGTVACYATSDSATIWSVKLPGPVVCAPAGADSIVYAGCTNGDVYALRLSDGNEIWRFASGLAIQTSIVTNGVSVYSVNRRGRVSALNATTGSVLWEQVLGTPVFESPALGDDLIVVPGTDGLLRAMNPINGEPLWTLDLGSVPAGSPLLVPGYVIAAAMDGRIIAANRQTGELVWETHIEGRIRTAPVLCNGILGIITGDGEFYGYESTK